MAEKITTPAKSDLQGAKSDTPATQDKFDGLISKDMLPEGWTQVKPMPKKFLYRGTIYVFNELKKADIERITSFKRNPFFEKKASV